MTHQNMALSRPQLATYLFEVREVTQIILNRLSEIRDISGYWSNTRHSVNAQLATSGEAFDDDSFRRTLLAQERLQAQFFGALEAFLAGWARLSLLLFPLEGGSKEAAAGFRRDRGRALQETLGIPPDSLLADRELRDSWMHFDERLDRAFMDGTFGERHRFVQSHEAKAFVNNTVVLMEVDSLLVHYSTQAGDRRALNLNEFETALVKLREALRGTDAG